MITGTIRNSVNLTMLQNKWQQKKDSGNVLSKEERNARANWTQADRLKHELEKQAESNKEANIRTGIDGKIMAGGTLTPEEEAYLAKKDPQALAKYRQTKMEKKAYEEKLKNCKTKDEVDRLKTNTMSGFLASFKKIENDPYIPISEKLAKAQEFLAKTRNIEDVELKFMATSDYEELPTEAELNAERIEESTAQFEENLEKIETSASDEENIEQVLPENPDEVEETEDADKKKKPIEKIDYHKEIEDIYNRIELNSNLENQVNPSDVASSKNYAGSHISIIV